MKRLGFIALLIFSAVCLCVQRGTSRTKHTRQTTWCVDKAFPLTGNSNAAQNVSANVFARDDASATLFSASSGEL